MDVLTDLFTSKKFIGMLVGIVASLLIALVPALEPLEQHLTEILAIIGAYILGQGIADNGKEAARIEKG